MAQQPDLKAVQARLAFSCVYEDDRLPKPTSLDIVELLLVVFAIFIAAYFLIRYPGGRIGAIEGVVGASICKGFADVMYLPFC